MDTVARLELVAVSLGKKQKKETLQHNNDDTVTLSKRFCRNTI